MEYLIFTFYSLTYNISNIRNTFCEYITTCIASKICTHYGETVNFLAASFFPHRVIQLWSKPLFCWQFYCEKFRGTTLVGNSVCPLSIYIVQVFKCLHGMAPDYLSPCIHRYPDVPPCIQTAWTPESSLCESRTARRPTRYIVVVRCSSLRACWSISVEHSARSSQESQSDSYNFYAPS